MKTTNWYAKKAGNDTQGLIIEEETGRSVAVAYDHRDTALLAAAPRLLVSLEALLPMWKSGIEEPWVVEARSAVAEAKGEKS